MKPPPVYLSPSTRHQHLGEIGIILSPRRRGVSSVVKSRALWALDNDCFNGPLDEEAWHTKLDALAPWRERCLFVVAPDVVGDHLATLALFDEYEPRIRAHGYPVALVTQDGLAPDAVPWDRLDALFIGGSDEHKLGSEAGALIAEAKRRGVWLHIGRVNSTRRLLQFWMADSWDGTASTFDPPRLFRLAAAVQVARAMQAAPQLFEDIA